MTKGDSLLAQVCLLERVLNAKANELAEYLKETNPAQSNLFRKDFVAINRTHEFFYKKIRPHMQEYIFEDFEILDQTISNFFKTQD